MEQFDDLSQFRFDGNGGTVIAKHISNFLVFCKCHEIDDGDVVCILFTLTLEGQVEKWWHTLQTTSIHSFDQFLKPLTGMIITMYVIILIFS